MLSRLDQLPFRLSSHTYPNHLESRPKFCSLAGLRKVYHPHLPHAVYILLMNPPRRAAHPPLTKTTTNSLSSGCLASGPRSPSEPTNNSRPSNPIFLPPSPGLSSTTYQLPNANIKPPNNNQPTKGP